MTYYQTCECGKTLPEDMIYYKDGLYYCDECWPEDEVGL